MSSVATLKSRFDHHQNLDQTAVPPAFRTSPPQRPPIAKSASTNKVPSRSVTSSRNVSASSESDQSGVPPAFRSLSSQRPSSFSGRSSSSSSSSSLPSKSALSKKKDEQKKCEPKKDDEQPKKPADEPNATEESKPKEVKKDTEEQPTSKAPVSRLRQMAEKNGVKTKERKLPSRSARGPPNSRGVGRTKSALLPSRDKRQPTRGVKASISFSEKVKVVDIPKMDPVAAETNFYTEDEIAEMRNDAFLESCGLDPNDYKD